MHELFTEFRMPSSNDTPPARLLVADDQADVLEALRWLLTGEGYEPDFVNSTDAVMERLRAHDFDLLLMDLNYTRDTTSGREGLELISRVRAHDASLPIVVMTGWGSIDTAVEAMRRGAKSFVQKPWEDATLLEILERFKNQVRIPLGLTTKYLHSDYDSVETGGLILNYLQSEHIDVLLQSLHLLSRDAQRRRLLHRPGFSSAHAGSAGEDLRVLSQPRRRSRAAD